MTGQEKSGHRDIHTYLAELEDISINLDGVFLTMKAEIRAMLLSGGGSIVNIGSVYGSGIALPQRAPYTASKAGVEGLSRSAALDYAAHNIRINVAALGMVDTPMTRDQSQDIGAWIAQAIPLKRIAQPYEIAAPVCFLLSEEASFMTGSVVVIDGGYTLN